MDVVIPPLRYGQAGVGLYRGSYPTTDNVSFLRRMRLAAIVSITPEPLGPLPGLDVEYVHIASAGEKAKSKKKRGVPITHDTVNAALDAIASFAGRPVYMHCLNGSQVTCLVIGCLRRQQKWAMASVLAEFSRFGDYDRADTVFIEAMPGTHTSHSHPSTPSAAPASNSESDAGPILVQEESMTVTL